MYVYQLKLFSEQVKNSQIALQILKPINDLEKHETSVRDNEVPKFPEQNGKHYIKRTMGDDDYG